MSERYDSTTARIEVFTRKAGMLSAVGHDLKLQAMRFQIAVDSGKVEAVVEAGALRVVAALRAGDEEVLSATDVAKIERAMTRDVLRTQQYPEVRFVGVLQEARCVGTLTLCGHSESLAVAIADRAVEFTVHQPRFGIRPYTAMLGGLRVDADVRVRVTLLT